VCACYSSEIERVRLLGYLNQIKVTWLVKIPKTPKKVVQSAQYESFEFYKGALFATTKVEAKEEIHPLLFVKLPTQITDLWEWVKIRRIMYYYFLV